jgi:hypothetical protein
MPPSPVKQTARPSTNGPAPKPGSMLAKAAPVNELVSDYVHVLLYGRNRLGKTLLACHFPKPLLLVSTEEAQNGGARTVKKIPGVKQLLIDRADDFDRLGDELEADPDCGGYETVVVDSGTALEELVLCRVMGWTEREVMHKVGKQAKVSQDQWMLRSEQVRQSLRKFFKVRKNLVICCNEKDHNPPKEQDSARRSPLAKDLPGPSEGRAFGASMAGGTTRWVQDHVDWICQLYMDQEMKAGAPLIVNGVAQPSEPEWTGRYERRLRMTYHPNYAAGARAEYDPSVKRRTDVPDFVVGPSPAEMFANFMKVVKGEPQC